MNVLVALLVPVMPVFAAAAPPSDAGGWLQLFQYGGAVTVLTLGFVAIIREWLVPGPSHRRIVEQLKLKDVEIERLRTYIEERAIPAIERANFVLEHQEPAAPPKRGTRP